MKKEKPDYQRGFEDALALLDEYAKSRHELAERFIKRGSPMAYNLAYTATVVEDAVRVVWNMARTAASTGSAGDKWDIPGEMEFVDRYLSMREDK